MKKTKNYQPDTVMKDFWRNSERFEDVCNGLLFHGEKMISHVKELDSEQATTLQQTSIQRRRDLLKLADIEGKSVIIGIENQQTRDKNIVFRDMEYTSYKYSIRNKDRKNKLYPIMTLILYYGFHQWKANHDLKEMMDMSKHVDNYVNNWKSHVFDVKEVNASLFRNKEVRDFFEGVQNLYSWDKDISHLKSIDMTYECAIAIGAVTGTEALIKKAEEVKGEMINMCIAVSEALEESRAIGIEQGRNEGIMLGKQEGKISERLQCIQKIMNNLKISASEAMTILDIPITEQETINKLINQS